MMHSFLLIGQSNMAGRGFPSEVEPISNENIYVQRNGRWWPMYTPVNCDRKTAGVCLAESFADSYRRDHPDVQIGLITCADGGTSLNQWMPGEVLYDHAVFCAKLAQRSSVLAGILWHQGESDTHENLYPLYQEKCTHILQSIRRDLGCPDVPVLVGGLGDFLMDWPKSDRMKNYVYVNAALEAMAAKENNFAFVPATGLGSNPDFLHFSAAALREFGLRYYDKFLTLTPVNTDGVQIRTATASTAIEAL